LDIENVGPEFEATMQGCDQATMDAFYYQNMRVIWYPPRFSHTEAINCPGGSFSKSLALTGG